MDVIYARRSQYNPTILFLLGIAGYVVLLCAVALAQSGALKAMANAFAVLLFLVLVSTAMTLRKESRQLAGFTSALFIYYTAIAASVIVTPTYASVATVLKLTMAPAFFLIGGAYEANRASWTWESREARMLFWAMAILPLLVLAWQISVGTVGIGAQPALSQSEDGAAFGIFANRNNAALYAVSLLALYNVLSGRPVKNVLFILVLCAAFGTLGVLVAAIAALTVAVGGRGAVKGLILAGLALGLAYLMMPEAPGLKRITPVVQSLFLLYEGSIDLRTVSFGQLVEMLGTTDLSFLFRLKHWLNLWDLYAGASAYEWLFGVGIGSSVPLTVIGLVPHNDYLRLLFECGILGFAGFVAMIGTIVWQCGRRWESVPLFIVSFYFISENLVNNYLAMAIFYFCAGSLATRMAEERDA
jgi:O-antigen ligase